MKPFKTSFLFVNLDDKICEVCLKPFRVLEKSSYSHQSNMASFMGVYLTDDDSSMALTFMPRVLNLNSVDSMYVS